MKILAGFAGLQVLCVGLLWRGEGQGGQIRIVEDNDDDKEAKEKKKLERQRRREEKRSIKEAEKMKRRGFGGWVGEYFWRQFIELERC